MEKKFAGKWVEKVLWGAGGVAGTILIVQLFDKLIK